MTVDHHLDHLVHDPARLAAAARSILSCPSGAGIAVEGVDDVLAGGDLGLQDDGGVPTFSCEPGSPLSRAAALGRGAVLTLESGLGAAGSAERDVTVTLGGSLRAVQRTWCACCEQDRDVVTLVVELVVLTRISTGARLTVPAPAFADDGLTLNRGFLQRSIEHANLCHHDELRRAVASLTGRRLAEVVGVALYDLRPGGVEVRWVGVDGAHELPVRFDRPAIDAADLGALLRRELHAGLC